MTVNLPFFVVGLSLGLAAGLLFAAAERDARLRQVREIVAAYEAMVAEILARRR